MTLDPVRRRGRPPQPPAARQATRERLLAATRQVFSRVGYHGLSVELVIREAGLSRPTYYKHFASVDEAIDLVLAQVNHELVDALLEAARTEGDLYLRLEAAMLAWRDWGRALGDMLRPLFAELHDEHSPASRHRLATLETLAQALTVLLQSLGRRPPPRVHLDALLNGMEYLGYRHLLQGPPGAAGWRVTRDAMRRLALGLLGEPADWAAASPARRVTPAPPRPPVRARASR